MSQTDDEENEKVFMIVVKPLEFEEEEGNDWEGTVKKFARVTQKSNFLLEKNLDKGLSKF